MPSASPPKAPELQIGDVVLDRYKIIEQIGTGGHSVVFKGTDERLSRPVCIKVFSGLGGESGVGRTSYEHFVQEAFALSRLTHPNTLRIYDFGHLGPKDAAPGGAPLQVCEYMNGGTLSNIVREQGPQSLGETARIVSAMCAALAEAHALGIVHRDIKPQNILFGSVGGNRLPKLADFGIAKWSAESEDSGQRAEDTAIVAGQKLAMYSPSWAAPEQLAGQAVWPATDIYSLACVAIYMLTGKAIFADEDVYAGYKKRRHADEVIKEAVGGLRLPRAVVDVFVRALAFDPKKRLGKVEDLAAVLSALDPSSEETSPPTVRLRGRNESTPVTPTTPVDQVTPPPSPIAGEPPTVPEGQALPSTAPAPAPIGRDPMPATFLAPAVQAWMAVAPSPSGMPRRLALLDTPQQVADRTLQFVMANNDAADLAGGHGTRIRVSLVPSPSGQRVVHVKGQTCFVSHLGGRPSPAVHVDRSSDIALVTPRAQEIGHLRVAQGTPGMGQTVFAVGNELVAVATEDCSDPILFDFGPGSNAYFVYTRGRSLPKPGRRG